MREAIEKLLEELKRAKVEQVSNDQWDHGWNSALKLCSDKLKEVLREHEDTGQEVEVRSAEDDR